MPSCGTTRAVAMGEDSGLHGAPTVFFILLRSSPAHENAFAGRSDYITTCMPIVRVNKDRPTTLSGLLPTQGSLIAV